MLAADRADAGRGAGIRSDFACSPTFQFHSQSHPTRLISKGNGQSLPVDRVSQ